jgi:hypothetical protein
VTDEILSGFDKGECTIMVFLDLSAAFDTIDIDRLVEILGKKNWYHWNSSEVV